ncbi:MAG: inosine/xanthosine triphosphatase [Acidobacteriota bacterium]|nr:inosine/xanthosine triphosphatase [Acidobacteriota bacterium]
MRESFGASPSISVPVSIVKSVVEHECELGDVIDEVMGETEIRSHQGAWRVFSGDLIPRSMSFQEALIAAFAPFYNAELYNSQQRF